MSFASIAAPAREVYRIFRREGLLSVVMRIVRRVRLWPFAMAHGRYRASLRLGTLAGRRKQPQVIFYRTEGSRVSARNFLLDIERRHQDGAIVADGAELVFSGNFEPDAFFSLATSIRGVSDVHVYSSWERVLAEIPYFVGAFDGDGASGITNAINLDDYPEDQVRTRFLTGNPYSLLTYAERKASKPITDTLLWRQQLIVLNLPFRDRVFERIRDEWREFFDLVAAYDRPQRFLIVGQCRDLVPQPSVIQKPEILFTADLGMSLLESLRAVRCAAGYIGAFDEFGLMTIGTDVPALLLNPAQPVNVERSTTDAPALTELATGQFLAERALTPRQVFEHYKRMVGLPRTP